MRARTLVRGTTFLVTDEAGDAAAGTQGLYVDDTRHLSCWQLSVGEAPLRVLGSHGTDVVLAPPTVREQDPAFTVFRGQALDGGTLVEQLRVRSHRRTPTTVTVSYRVAADFADQFELRGDAHFDKPGGRHGSVWDNGELRLIYRRDRWHRQTVITSSAPATRTDDGLVWTLDLPPLGEVVLGLRVGAEAGDSIRCPAEVAEEACADAEQLLGGVVVPDHGLPDLRAAVDRGLADLADLRVPAPGRAGPEGAGCRCAMVSDVVRPRQPDHVDVRVALPAGPCGGHAARAGGDPGDRSGRFPGRGARQDRARDPAGRAEHPRSDAVRPLLRHGGRHAAVPHAAGTASQAHGRRARVRTGGSGPRGRGLDVRHGGLDEHGYLVYRTDGSGLVHQCWKDSARSICFASGEPAHGPIAACEVQGYAYEALLSHARSSRATCGTTLGYGEWLDRARRAAARSFARDFWLPEQDFVALALDGARRQVDALASERGARAVDRHPVRRSARRRSAAASPGRTSSPGGESARSPRDSRRTTRSRITTAGSGRTTRPSRSPGSPRRARCGGASGGRRPDAAAAAGTGHRPPEVLAGVRPRRTADADALPALVLTRRRGQRPAPLLIATVLDTLDRARSTVPCGPRPAPGVPSCGPHRTVPRSEGAPPWPSNRSRPSRHGSPAAGPPR